MTVQNVLPEKRYAANGVTTAFTIPFLLIEATDLDVFLNGVAVTSGFTLTGVGNPTSTITFTTAPLGDLYLVLDVPFQRLTDYQENGDFLATTVNRDYDRIWQALKQLNRGFGRALSLGNTDVDGMGMYRAKGNGIADLKDPVNPQDATTKNWVSSYFASLIDGATGLINTTTGILYDAGTLFDYLRFGVGRNVDSIADLKNLSSARNQRAFVLSFYAGGPVGSGGGHYRVRPGDITSAEIPGILVIANDGARWELCHNGTIDTAQAGCSPSLANNSVPFNAASAYVATFGGKLTIQAAELTFTGQIFLKNGVIYEGRGVKIDGGGTKFTYTGTSDFALIQNTINGSTSANIDISGIWFLSNTQAIDSALLFDTASSVVVLTRCRFNSNAIGIIHDQSELWDVRFCSFLCSSSTAVGVWLVNGTEKNATSQQFFTNRICYWGCEFNGAAGAVGVYDDGGAVHAFLHCNFNAMGSHIIHTAVNGLLIHGGEYEIPSAQMFIQRLIRRKGAVSPPSSSVVMSSAYLYNNLNQTIYAATTGAVQNLVIRDCIINTPSGNVPFSGLDQSTINNMTLENNQQTGLGAGGAAINNVIKNATAIIGWTSTGTQPAIGNGLISARYDRDGKDTTYRLTLQLGTTSTPGTGNYIFTLPFVVDSTSNVLGQIGSCYLLIPGSGYFACVARVIPGTSTVGIYTTNGNPVGAGVPAAFVNGTVLEFQVKCGSLLPI